MPYSWAFNDELQWMEAVSSLMVTRIMLHLDGKVLKYLNGGNNFLYVL